MPGRVVPFPREPASTEVSRAEPSADRLAYRLPDVARLTGLSLTTVQRLVAEGHLPAVRVGRAVLVRRQDLEDFVAGLPPLRPVR
jgi:excisionase family DNA binding protein